MKGNWLLGNLHDSELRELISKGLAFQASPFVIPVLHVYSIKEYLSLIETYIGTENKLVQRPFYLRGQNEDYFSNGRLQILPPAYRKAEWWSLYNTIDTNLAKELRGLLDPWEDCLRKEFGRSFGQAYVKILYFPEDPPTAQRVVTSNLPSDLVVNNILAMAVLQHYGFPTPCLDVTRSPAIALWFALHKAHTVEEGVTYRALESVEHSAVNNTDSLRHLPSVYIFSEFVPEPPTIDYGEFKWLKKISIRPYLQSAASLPFKSVYLNVYRRIGEALISRFDAERSPVGVIKIHFSASQLRMAYPDLSQESIFPDSDPLHRVFCSVRPPQFIRYVSEIHRRDKTKSDVNSGSPKEKM